MTEHAHVIKYKHTPLLSYQKVLPLPEKVLNAAFSIFFFHRLTVIGVFIPDFLLKIMVLRDFFFLNVFFFSAMDFEILSVGLAGIGGRMCCHENLLNVNKNKLC